MIEHEVRSDKFIVHSGGVVEYVSGKLTIVSGEGSNLSPDLVIQTGQPAVNSNSGNILIQAGAVSGSGVPGSIQLQASTVLIPKTGLPTGYALASEYLHIGEAIKTSNALRAIGFGYTGGAAANAPAYIGAIESDSNGQTTNDFIVAVRAGTTDIAPDPRFKVLGNGGFEFITNGVMLQYFQASLATNDAASNLLQTIPLATSSVALIEFKIVAAQSNGTSATFIRTVKAKNVGGTVSVQTSQSDYTQSDDATWAVAIAASTASITLKVTGAASATVNWNVTATITPLSF